MERKLPKIQVSLISEISDHVIFIKENVDKMVDERKKANNLIDSENKATAYCDKVKPYFDGDSVPC